MSLAERVATPAPRVDPFGLRCTVGKLRRQLSPEEARALDEMIWELGWTDKQIYAEIVAEGHDVSLQGIGRHRLRMCRCSKGVQ